MSESLDDKVERIAKALFEVPCPPEDGPDCNADMHIWKKGRDAVRFILKEAGLD